MSHRPAHSPDRAHPRHRADSISGRCVRNGIREMICHGPHPSWPSPPRILPPPKKRGWPSPCRQQLHYRGSLASRRAPPAPHPDITITRIRLCGFTLHVRREPMRRDGRSRTSARDISPLVNHRSRCSDDIRARWEQGGRPTGGPQARHRPPRSRSVEADPWRSPASGAPAGRGRDCSTRECTIPRIRNVRSWGDR